MTLDHPDYQAMLAAVLADPADDMPRLVLADWLDGHAKEVECPACKGYGHKVAYYSSHSISYCCPDCSGSGRVPNGFAEYGEFIRVQCDLSDWRKDDAERSLSRDGIDRHTALRTRERDLLELHWHDWSGRFGTYCGNFHDTGAVGVTFRRGFVDEIRCPLRLWVGDECPVCGGERYIATLEGTMMPCGRCHGLGTVGGIGPELVRRCPLTRVTLTDREPAHEIHVNYEIGIPAVGWGWCRVPGAQPGRRHHLPPELFDRMELPICPSYPEIKQAPTRQAALDALSAACLGWARATPTNTTESPREGATR